MIGKKWYANQKARNEAKKAGLERPRTGGIGDKISDKLEDVRQHAEERAEHYRDLKAQGVNSIADLHEHNKQAKSEKS